MYIIDYDRQLSLINEMKQLRRDTKKYEVFYHHPYSNQMWKSFFPRADKQELGPKVLRHEPVPNDITQNLDQCLSEDEPENAIGLGIEWSAKVEMWPQIIQILEQKYTGYFGSQIKLFLEHLKMGEKISENGKEEVIIEADSSRPISDEQLNNLIWRSRKIRMKRFFVLG